MLLYKNERLFLYINTGVCNAIFIELKQLRILVAQVLCDTMVCNVQFIELNNGDTSCTRINNHSCVIPWCAMRNFRNKTTGNLVAQEYGTISARYRGFIALKIMHHA